MNRRGNLSRTARRSAAMAALAVIAAASLVVSIALPQAIAASLGTLTVERIKHQVTEQKPTLILRDNWTGLADEAAINNTLLLMNNGSGTFTTTGAPTWWAAKSGTTGGWRKETGFTPPDNGVDCSVDNAVCNTGGALASVPWTSHSSYVQVQFVSLVASTKSGLCLLCTDSTGGGTGVVAILRKQTPNWYIDVGRMVSGTFTAASTTNLGSIAAPNYQTFKLAYDVSSGVATATLNGANATTYTVNASDKSNTRLALVTVARTSTQFLQGTFEAAYV